MENIKTKTVSILFFCLFVFSLIFTITTKFDEISTPYFKGIRRSIQTDVIFKDKMTPVFYDNNPADISIKINENHYLFGEKTYKKVSKIVFKDKSKIKEYVIYNGNKIQKTKQIPDSIEVDNEKNILEKFTITFLSFFYNYKLFLLSYLFLILAVSFSNFKLNHKITFFLISFLGLLFRITQLNDIPFWDDEIYVLTHTAKSAKLIEMFCDPGNPPLFFILFKIWRNIVQKEEFFRIIAVVFGVLFNYCFYVYIKTFLNKAASLIGYFMVSISLILIYFSQEIRCYMLLMLLAILSSILLFKYKNRKTEILYFINSILLLNTHFYGVFIWFFNFIFGISIYKNKKPRLNSFLINNIISFLIFIPNVLLKQQSLKSAFNTWIQEPKFGDFVQVLKNFSISMVIFVLFLTIIFCLYKKTKSKRKKLFLRYNILAICCVILFSFVFSYVVKPIFVYRYFYVIYPYYLALVVFVVCYDYKTVFNFFFRFLFFILFSTTGRLNTQNLYNNSNLYFNFVKQDIDVSKRNYIFFNNTVKNYPLYETPFKNKGELIYLKVDEGGVVDINPMTKGIKKPCVCYIINLYLKNKVYIEADSIEIYKTPLGVISKVKYN